MYFSGNGLTAVGRILIPVIGKTIVPLTNFDRAVLKVRKTKGDKHRHVPYGSEMKITILIKPTE